jgi:integrase
MVWIARTLGPALLECAQGVAARFKECEDAFVKWKRITNKKAMRGKKPVTATTVIRKYIAQFQWRQPDGALLSELPFRMLGLSPGQRDMTWPPRTYSEVKELLKTLQTAHLFIFLLSTGGRISETLSLREGCIVESAQGIYTANGKTYKLVFDNAGATRDWPLPEMALHAISQQEKLSVALTAIGRMDLTHAQKRDRQTTGSIWKSVGFQGKGFKASYNYSMRRTMAVLNLSEWMDDDPLSAHRFRKTIARLIALAMVGAPKILMDLFGHKSIEMTLHYILTDPGIRSEMAEVAKAQTIMLATDAVREAEILGGPAAAAVRGAAAAERVRLGADFGEEDLRRLAETLTFGGRTWQLVRPGVICTKGPQQTGPCNRSLGHPEPSRCRSSCGHRLEQSFLREDTDRALAQAVEFLEAAQAEDDPIAVEMWHGQILAHLPRFPDLAQKWRCHPAIARLEAQ